MTGRRWIEITFAMIAIVLALDLAASYVIDPYGVLRNPSGRKLEVYYSERNAKFLLSKRYVPENYDSLIIGHSESSNWDLSSISGYRFYNESIRGANATEDKLVVDQALQTGHFKVAICNLIPTLTNAHRVREGLDKVTAAMALGSLHEYASATEQLLRFLRSGSRNDTLHPAYSKGDSRPNGTMAVRPMDIYSETNVPSSGFALDPVALRDYRQLTQSLRDHGTKLLYVVPPVYEDCYLPNREAYTTYRDKLKQELPPAPVIDFSTPEYEEFRKIKENFGDCFHLSPAGAEQMDQMLDKLVPEKLDEYYGAAPK